MRTTRACGRVPLKIKINNKEDLEDLPVKALRVQSEETQLDDGVGEEEDGDGVSSQLVDFIRVLGHVDAHAREVDGDEDRMGAGVDLTEEAGHATIFCVDEVGVLVFGINDEEFCGDSGIKEDSYKEVSSCLHQLDVGHQVGDQALGFHFGHHLKFYCH
ncbi:hypothetical protein SFRURICE_010526, partial [Spodoptera frugiperda]